jgi:two-component system CitB family sensor kinase
VKKRVPLAYQLLIYQVGVLLLAIVAGALLILWQARQELDRQYEQRALAVAESVAAIPSIQQALLAGDPSRFIESTAEALRHETGASYIVVANRQGIRFSHPNAALIGKPIDESPATVLAGNTWVGVQRGTLGVSARGKAPIRSGGQVIGMVSVGYLETSVGSHLLGELPMYGLGITVSLLLGIAGSLLLARRLKRQTLGLEPYEITGLLEEREASLHGIREGALATDRSGRITLANPEAIRLLALPPDVLGKPVGQVLPPGRTADFVAGRLKDADELLLSGDKVVLARRRPVEVRGEPIGHVITLLDTGELNDLSGGLGVAGLTDALRAQAHEYSNRLHTIAGLIELGRPEEAMSLIEKASRADQQLSAALVEKVGDPVLSALLLSKAAVALERGIELEISSGTTVAASRLPAHDLITLVGNLVDNALDAVAGAAGERRVSVSVQTHDGQLAIQVRDTGPGVPPAILEKIFSEGFSTKPRMRGRPRGLGLALVLETVRRLGGEVDVANDGGAVFTVRVPVLAAPEPTVAAAGT